jgi:pimeloyl-ACP methyl ester carboxylesterase
VIDGSGHFPVLERPGETAKLTIDSLTRA